MVALIFVVFDVEIALTFPVAVIFKQWNESGNGFVVFSELMFFVGILIAGLVYVWRKGDLDWIRRVEDTFQQGSK